MILEMMGENEIFECHTPISTQLRSSIIAILNSQLPVSTEPEQVSVHDDEWGVVVGERDLDRSLQDGVVNNARIVDAVVQLLRRFVVSGGPVDASEMRLRGPRLPK